MGRASAIRLKSLVSRLTEPEVWNLLRAYFHIHLNHKADIVHGTGEHGNDVVVHVNSKMDILGKGYYILIQAKKGNLTLAKWRKILFQLLELPYFTIPHHEYRDRNLARRILLVVTGSIDTETRESIAEFNSCHDATIDVWALDDLVEKINGTKIARELLQVNTRIGETRQKVTSPPALGESDRRSRPRS